MSVEPDESKEKEDTSTEAVEADADDICRLVCAGPVGGKSLQSARAEKGSCSASLSRTAADLRMKWAWRI